MSDIVEQASEIILSFLKPPKFSGGSWTINPDAAAKALADAGLLAEEQELVPGRWWRAEEPDGTPWAESSDEQEVRERMLPGQRLFRQHRTVPQIYWVEED